MIIGTDVSSEVCKREGYIQIEYKVKTLQPNKRKKDNAIDADASINIFSYMPADILEEQGYFTHGSRCMEVCGDGKTTSAEWPLNVDECYTGNELWETYLDKKPAIDNMIGGEHVFPQTPYDLLNLASDLCHHGIALTH